MRLIKPLSADINENAIPWKYKQMKLEKENWSDVLLCVLETQLLPLDRGFQVYGNAPINSRLCWTCKILFEGVGSR